MVGMKSAIVAMLAVMFCSGVGVAESKTILTFKASGRSYKPNTYAFQVCVGDKVVHQSEDVFPVWKDYHIRYDDKLAGAVHWPKPCALDVTKAYNAARDKSVTFRMVALKDMPRYTTRPDRDLEIRKDWKEHVAKYGINPVALEKLKTKADYSDFIVEQILISDIKLIKDGAALRLGKWTFGGKGDLFKGAGRENDLLIEIIRLHPVSAGVYGQFTSEAPAEACDLAVGAKDISISAGRKKIKPYDVQPGQEVNISVDVANIGSAPSGACEVHMFVGDELHQKKTLKAVRPGKKATVSFKWKAPSPQCAKLIKFAVDPENSLTEATKNNNRAYKLITGPHPYLFFYKHEIEEFKKSKTRSEAGKKIYQAVIRKADGYLKKTLPDAPSGKAAIDVSKAAMYMGLAYALTQDGKYAEKTSQCLLSIDLGGRTMEYLEAGFLTGMFLAYDFVADSLKPDAKKKIEPKLLEMLHYFHQPLELPSSVVGFLENRVVGGRIRKTVPSVGKGPQGRMRPLLHTGISCLAMAGCEDASKGYSADELLIPLLGAVFGRPEPEPHCIVYGHGRKSLIEYGMGPDGVYYEGEYYSKGIRYFPFWYAANRMGFDSFEKSRFKAYYDWMLRTMTPERTLAIHNNTHRQKFGRFEGLSTLFSAFRNTNGHVHAWAWEKTGKRTYGTDELARLLGWDQDVYDKRTPPGKYYETPAQFLLGDGVCILRSDWTENATWMSLLADNIACSTSHRECHKSGFSIFAHGAYLAIDNGDGRVFNPIYAVACGIHEFPPYMADKTRIDLEGPRGHNLVLIDGIDGSQHLGVPSAGIAMREAGDKAYLQNYFTTKSLDFAEVWMPHEGFYFREKVDVNNRRSVIFAHHEYFIVADHLDELKPDRVHTYDWQLQLGGKAIKTSVSLGGVRKNILRKMAGKILIDGNEIPWGMDDKMEFAFKDQKNNIIKRVAGGSRIDWRTQNEKGEPVGLQAVFLYPKVNILVGVGPGDHYQHRYVDPFVHPYIRARVKAGDARFLTVLYPYKSDAKAHVKPLKASGGAAGEITVGKRRDIVCLNTKGQGEVSAGGLKSDGYLAFVSTSAQGVDKVLMVRGRQLSYGGREILSSSKPLDSLVINFKADGASGHVNGAAKGVRLVVAGAFKSARFRRDCDPALPRNPNPWKDAACTVKGGATEVTGFEGSGDLVLVK